MNILITGATGMLGSVIANKFCTKYSVFATGSSINFFYNKNISFRSFNLMNDSYEELIDWCIPDLIIHCAALTKVNECEMDPLKAFQINGISIEKLLKATNDNVKIIYISTDAVFPFNTSFETELDFVNPESVYGKSKELGEFFLLKSKRKFTIIRTTIVGFNKNSRGSSLTEWIINSIIKNEPINLFEDVYFNPISIWDLAEELFCTVVPKNLQGIYHISGSEIISKYQFGIKLISEMGLNISLINKSSIDNYGMRSNRRKNQSLCCQKYASNFKRSLPDIENTIKQLVNYYGKN